MERPNSPEHGITHLARCIGDLALMAARELYVKAGEAIDAAWPADSAEDAETYSDIFTRER